FLDHGLRRDVFPKQPAGTCFNEGVPRSMSLRNLFEPIVGSADITRRGAPLLVVGFLADAAFLFVYLVVLQTYLPESLGASKAVAGWALAAYGLAKLVTQLGAGMISDRLGTRRALIAGTGLL